MLEHFCTDCVSSFFQAGNYQAAINVYTHAIRLDCKMPAYPCFVLLMNSGWTFLFHWFTAKWPLFS